jgi:hypothetical protein
MKRTLSAGLFALAVCLAGASETQAWHPTPIRVDFTFRFDVQTDHHPTPSFPWWTYFPYDPHLMTLAPAPDYSHWGAPLLARARQPLPPRPAAPAPNVVWQPGRTPVQPASYQPAPAHGFAVDR